MKRARIILAVLLLSPAGVFGAEKAPPAQFQSGMLNLSCLAALTAVGHAGDLGGIFSFITEKDSSAAFADFMVHSKPSFKKYLLKLDADSKGAGGVTSWDHEVVMRILEIYDSPLAETLEPLTEAVKKKLADISAAPTLTLEDITARRKR